MKRVLAALAILLSTFPANAQQISPSTVATIANVAALNASNFQNTPNLMLKGYYAVGDGGGGQLSQISGSCTPDSVITFQDNASHCFQRQLGNSTLSIYQAGAKCDGTTDTGVRINAAIAAMPIGSEITAYGNGTNCLITTPIVLNKAINFHGDATFALTTAIVGFTVSPLTGEVGGLTVTGNRTAGQVAFNVSGSRDNIRNVKCFLLDWCIEQLKGAGFINTYDHITGRNLASGFMNFDDGVGPVVNEAFYDTDGAWYPGGTFAAPTVAGIRIATEGTILSNVDVIHAGGNGGLWLTTNNYRQNKTGLYINSYFDSTVCAPGIAITNNNFATVTSGSYNSSTGLVTLNLSTALGLSPGGLVTVSGITGTGSFASANGNDLTLGTGTTGSVITYTVATGLTMTITGGNVGQPINDNHFDQIWSATGATGLNISGNGFIQGQYFKGMPIQNNYGYGVSLLAGDDIEFDNPLILGNQAPVPSGITGCSATTGAANLYDNTPGYVQVRGGKLDNSVLGFTNIPSFQIFADTRAGILDIDGPSVGGASSQQFSTFATAGNVHFGRLVGLNTQTQGSVTIASGSGFATFAHGLSLTPSPTEIHAQPIGGWVGATNLWVSNCNATTCDVDANATLSGTLTFGWTAAITAR